MIPVGINTRRARIANSAFIDTTFMHKIITAFILAIATLGAAQAQNVAQAPEAKQMRFLVGMGLTVGGDKLAHATYTDGDNINIRAGEMIAFNTGIDYRVTPEFSFQATIGYHTDRAGAKNGDLSFTRIPMELLAYYNVNQQWRIGGGARYVSSPKLSSSGAAYIGNYEFKNALSAVAEAEYMMGQHWGFKVRLVSEKFEEKFSGNKVDGNHIGFFGTYYF